MPGMFRGFHDDMCAHQRHVRQREGVSKFIVVMTIVIIIVVDENHGIKLVYTEDVLNKVGTIHRAFDEAEIGELFAICYAVDICAGVVFLEMFKTSNCVLS